MLIWAQPVFTNSSVYKYFHMHIHALSHECACGNAITHAPKDITRNEMA